MSSPRRIDVHHHVVPPAYGDLLRSRHLMPGGIEVPQWSPRSAAKLMDQAGVATAILSLSTPGVWFGSADEARRLAREVNDYTAGLVADDPARFGYFATLTLPDVDGAVREAQRTLDAGADGVVLLANSDGVYLHDKRNEPLLALLNERGAVVFVHPGELPAEPVEGIPTFTADFLLDTTRAAIGLILTGALDRYPNIKFILAHAGGMLPYIAYRVLLTQLREESKLSQAAALVRRKAAVRERLDETLRRFWFDTAISATPAALPSLLATADPTKVVYGSDYPFMPDRAVGFINAEYEDYPLDPALRSGIDRSNAEQLFPRLATSGTAAAAPVRTKRRFGRRTR
ncbi:MAG: amidohydrolase family protein [Nocardioides sp.]|uniref:amidohydrolase family protein n=1 Tax=Nocardioides sp. TaxID=35761 RepID=UPI0039E6F372